MYVVCILSIASMHIVVIFNNILEFAYNTLCIVLMYMHVCTVCISIL